MTARDKEDDETKDTNMALITNTGTCRHRGEPITRRRYAAPYAVDENARKYGVDIWVTGNGQYPGDQRVCESNELDDDIGSWGRHEPTGSDA